MQKLFVKTVGNKLQRGTLYDTRQDVLLDPLHAFLLPTFQQIPEPK